MWPASSSVTVDSTLVSVATLVPSDSDCDFDSDVHLVVCAAHLVVPKDRFQDVETGSVVKCQPLC
jgi:hypothetical protein